MLGVLARRATAGLFDDADYPSGRLNAVRIGPPLSSGQNLYIFKRDDGSRRASFTPPRVSGGVNLQTTDSSRVAGRNWPLYQVDDGTWYFTADYTTDPTNIRVPTAAENPDGNFRRVYDQTIESWIVTLSTAGVITKVTRTGVQTFLGGARSTIPGPSDTFTRKTQTGYKVLTALCINGDPTYGTGQGSGDISGTGFQSRYPAATATGVAGGFNLSIAYPGTHTSGGVVIARGTDAGDTTVTDAPARIVLTRAGGMFTELNRPVTETELPVSAEKTF